jgi:pyruvate/2-oxoglutarate dehydrogenase complex dihydrolipoamide dehydrogenase (E3) component
MTAVHSNREVAMAERYDAIIIGAGQAGPPLAYALAQSGKRTAIIERRYVGGTCVNTGCTPTKTMIASAQVAYIARRAGDFGVHTGPVEVRLSEIVKRKREIVQSFRESNASSLEDADSIDLIRGEARFIDRHTVSVKLADGAARELSSEWIFINTGARSLIPPIDGLDSVTVYDNESMMELEEVPHHLLIVGGGYIGLEFGQMFRRFGSQVTIVERSRQLVGNEDDDIAGTMAEILREDGIEVLLQSNVTRVEPHDDGGVIVTVESKKANQPQRRISVSHLMLAVGRIPNTEALDLDRAGIKTDDKGYIQVNEQLETNVPGIYAMGDVKGGPAFTHISYDDYRVICANLLDGEPNGKRTINDRLLPYTVFTDPQLGRVGLSESQAREQGYQVKIAKMPVSSAARAIETGQTRGMMKVVINAEDDTILGCAILAPEGGELMSLLQIAMMGGLSYTAIRDGIFAHPTFAESLNNLFTQVK